MAYTKVFAVRSHLARAVSYAANPDKTALDEAVGYALNPDKTEQRLFESAVNCQSPATAFEEMTATKRRYGKTDKVLAYHFIQSFRPGETTPKQAHAIGVEFARHCFGERFECVIGTHLDKNHLHNHVVVNSVSFTDGGKYHSSPGSYFYKIRGESDALCREYGLSVIDPEGKGKHYAEWSAEQAGRLTLRGMIRTDIDAVIQQSYTFQSFLDGLKKKGYAVRQDPNRKYITVKPPGAKRPVRLTEKSLGAGYSEDAIRERLSRQRSGQAEPPETPAPKRYRYTGPPIKPGGKKKLKGFLALYWHYLYLLGKVKRGKSGRRMTAVLRAEVIKLDRYNRQFLYLYRHNITTMEELQTRKRELETQIQTLTEQRRPLYAERKAATDEAAAAALSGKISGATARLRELRKERDLCARIMEAAPDIHEKTIQARETEERPEPARAKPDHEKFKLL